MHLWVRRVDVINSFLGIGISEANHLAFGNVIRAHNKKEFLKTEPQNIFLRCEQSDR